MRLSELSLPESARSFSRFIAPPERLALQGKDPAMALLLERPSLVVKAAGNAYPVPMVLAGLEPCIRAIGNTPGKLQAAPVLQEPWVTKADEAIAMLNSFVAKESSPAKSVRPAGVKRNFVKLKRKAVTKLVPRRALKKSSSWIWE